MHSLEMIKKINAMTPEHRAQFRDELMKSEAKRAREIAAKKSLRSGPRRVKLQGRDVEV